MVIMNPAITPRPKRFYAKFVFFRQRKMMRDQENEG